MIVSDKMSSDTFLFSFPSAHYNITVSALCPGTPGAAPRAGNLGVLQSLPAPLVCISHGFAMCRQPAAPGAALSPWRDLGTARPQSSVLSSPAQQESFLERQESSACLALPLLPRASDIPEMGRATVGIGPEPQQSWAGTAAPPVPAEPTVGRALPRLRSEHRELLPIRHLCWGSSECPGVSAQAATEHTEHRELLPIKHLCWGSSECTLSTVSTVSC